MGLPYEERTKAFGAPTPSTQQRLTRQARRAWQRADRCFAIARFVAEIPGTTEAKQDAVEAAMKAGLIPIGAVPSARKIRRLEGRYRNGAIKMEDYQDGPRSGRPPKRLPNVIEQRIQEVVKGGRETSAHRLTADLQELAAAAGVEPPTYHDVHRRFADAGRLRLAAARHGSRAAEINAAVHIGVPSRHTHDTWALDELRIPISVRRWSPVLGRFESGDRDLIMIVDLKSTVVVGWEIADASRRAMVDAYPGEHGFDRVDVLGALLNAACPELAPDSTRLFAGYLPNRLRWDSAQPHKSLAAWINEAPGLDFDVRRIQKMRPDRNGAAENRVKLLKAMCTGIRGYKGDYLPTDRVDNDAKANLGHSRTRAAAGSQGPVSRKIPIAPEQLLDDDELRVEIDRVIYQYNFKHVNSFFRARPVDLYHQHLAAKTPRRGHDLVRALEPSTTLVSTNGIRHYAEGREFRFTAEVDGAMLMVDKAVTYYADPLNRGVFLLWDRRLHFLRPHNEPSATRAARYAKSWAAVARSHSDEADAIRKASFIVDLGTRAFEQSESAYASAVESYMQQQSGAGTSHPTPPRAHSSAEPAAPEFVDRRDIHEAESVVQPQYDPWKDNDPNAFVRRRKQRPLDHGAHNDD